MNHGLNKLYVIFLAPVLLLSIGIWITTHPAIFKAPQAELLFLAPYLIALPGAFMAHWFNRTAAVYILAALAITHASLNAFIPGVPGGDVNGQVIYAAICLLLPVNISVFALMPERGLFTITGLTKTLAILLQVILLLAVLNGDTATHKAFGELLHFRLFDPAFDAATYVTQPGILLYMAASIALTGRLLVSRSIMDGGALAALIASALALHMIGRGPGPSTFIAIATLMITGAVIRDAYNMAFIDELTGIPARRALVTAMKELGGTYTIAMLDIDHFKKFNDTYGHDIGDQVLQMVASHMARVSGGGHAFRYGGEEFSVLFANKSIEESWDHLDQLRENIADGHFTMRDKLRPNKKPETPRREKTASNKIGVTISIGVADNSNRHSIPEEVLKAADKALYKAKQAGRNQVSI